MKKIITLAAAFSMCVAGSAFANKDHMEAMVDEHMKMMDTDGDGMVSKDEHAAGGEKMFAEADKNGDGMLSKQEMLDMKMKKKEEVKGKKKGHSGDKSGSGQK